MSDITLELTGASFSARAGMIGGLTTATRLPDNHPFYSEIGRVAARWAHLEHILDQMLWELAKGDDAALSCITGQLVGHYGRSNALKALSELRGLPKALITKINKLDLYSAATNRNRIVHDAWFLQSDGHGVEKVGQFKSQLYKVGTFGFVEVTSAEVADTITQIQTHIDEALEIFGEIRQEMASTSTGRQ